jgi:hypothetical protein
MLLLRYTTVCGLEGLLVFGGVETDATLWLFGYTFEIFNLFGKDIDDGCRGTRTTTAFEKWRCARGGIGWESP